MLAAHFRECLFRPSFLLFSVGFDFPVVCQDHEEREQKLGQKGPQRNPYD